MDEFVFQGMEMVLEIPSDKRSSSDDDDFSDDSCFRRSDDRKL